MEKQWKVKKKLRERVDQLQRYNDYLREEVAEQHTRYLNTRNEADRLFTRIDRAQKELFRKVHDARRSESLNENDSSFAAGWNQAIDHVEAMISELLGVDEKAAYEEFGI